MRIINDKQRIRLLVLVPTERQQRAVAKRIGVRHVALRKYLVGTFMTAEPDMLIVEQFAQLPTKLQKIMLRDR